MNITKKRFRDVVEEVHYEDLLKIRDDLSKGGNHIKGLISKKIYEIEKEKVKDCATCGAEINPFFMDDFSLTFGRRDFKKRAFFCGSDCLKHFLNKLEKI